MFRFVACTIFAVFTLAAQTFSAASIRPSAGAGNNGSVLTIDAAHMNYTGASLSSLLALAYDVRPDQIVGPKWLNDERFDITATAPAGTTDVQARTMLQNLLTEKFHMTVHEETKARTFYALVPAPGGIKMKPVEKPEINATVDLSSEKIQLKDYTMVSFANFLTNAMRQPVVNETGLTGSYDITLFIPMEDLRSAKAMSAIHELGLNFEKRNAPTKMIVVDKADKTPTGV